MEHSLDEALKLLMRMIAERDTHPDDILNDINFDGLYLFDFLFNYVQLFDI